MGKNSNFHESYKSRQIIQVGSDRGFGLVFATLFALIGFWPLMDEGQYRQWALVLSACLLLCSILLPTLLRPFKIVWFRFGLLLHKVANPLIMAVIFFAVFWPIALYLRLRRTKLLDLSIKKEEKTYWIDRDPPGPKPDSMKDQF